MGTKRKIWNIPVLRTEEEMNIHRNVTWLELFFDLFFVVAIASLAHQLSADYSKVLEFVMLFIPVWWIWIGFTFYNERFETEGLENRVFIFLLMIPIACMAIFAHHALKENFTNYVLSYAAGRIIIAFLWARAAYWSKPFRAAGIRSIIGFTIAIVLCLLAATMEGDLKFTIFGVALFVDLAAPFTAVAQQAKLPKLSTSKLPERFGLFTIIVLGEMVVGVIGGMEGSHHVTVDLIARVVLGVGIGIGFWWVYFDFVARRPFHPNMSITYAWSYLHMPLVMGYIIVGAGLLGAVKAEEVIPHMLAHVILLGAAISMVSIGFLEICLDKSEDEPMHPIVSPGLKFVVGIVLFILSFQHIPWDPWHILLTIFGSQFIIMIYGFYNWFNQELEGEGEEAPEIG